MSRRHAIGLVTSYIRGRFFELVLAGIEAVARERKVDLVVFNGTPEDIALTQIGQHCVDGWLVLTYTQGIELLAQQGQPIITISAHTPQRQFPGVFPDNQQGIEAVMEHLFAQGHERIGFVGNLEITDIEERYRGYIAALQRRGLQLDPTLVFVTDSPMEDRGVLAAQQFLAAGASCDAMVVGNDWNAIGFMRELQAHGYRIPEDMAIVGFDDIPEAQTTTPPLSTVRQSINELGATAATLLLTKLAGGTVNPAPHYVPTIFVPRESSGASSVHLLYSRQTRAGAGEGPWQETLSKELIDLLFPTTYFDPALTPAQIWPESTLLIKILEETVGGSSSAVELPQQLNAVSSSLPMLNATPESLMGLVHSLSWAGAKLGGAQPDPQEAQTRLQVLLDQLFMAILRAQRQRQELYQHIQREAIKTQYRISKVLLQGAPEHLGWLGETEMYSGCLGLWMPAGMDLPATLEIAGAYCRDGSTTLMDSLLNGAENIQFPPLDQLPSSAHPDDIITCLILPVSIEDHDWGMLAVSGPIISKNPWFEDSTSNLLEICSILLGNALKREALQEEVKGLSESEQILVKQIRA
jgi:DNA-binding LacI/PurR family transcriptional regulator